MKPIIYKSSVLVRFSDLDPYGHVNFKHYFDYVISSRLQFLELQFEMSLAKLAKLGLGFYATRGEIEFLLPITGLRELDIESFVDTLKNEATLVIPFTIKDSLSEKVYSQGKIDFTIIDLKNGKPTELNDSSRHFFFYNE